MNPTNIGAIFRSAAALGMDAVLLTEAGSDPLYRRACAREHGHGLSGAVDVSRSGGTLAGLRCTRSALKPRRSRCGTTRLSIADPRLAAESKSSRSVLGTEGDGLANDTIADCDYTVRIPMSHGVDSLNVAAASAVAFYQLGTLCRKTEEFL